MRYRQALLPLQVCSRDQDCEVERRGRAHSGLDGCARFLRRDADVSVEAEPLADLWLGRGCAHAFMTCTDERAQCVDGTCAELPPDPIPRSWHRWQYRDVFSFFVPSGTVEEKVAGEDSDVGRLRAPQFVVGFDYGPYAAPLDADEAFGEVVLHHEPVTVSGFEGLLIAKRSNDGSFISGVHLPEIGSSRWGRTSLTLFAECRTESACRAALDVARSLELH